MHALVLKRITALWRLRQQPSVANRVLAFAQVGGMLLFITFAVVVQHETVSAQVIERDDITGPLLEGEPFDVLTLNKANKNALIKIQPPENLEIPFPKNGDLVFEFAEDSEFPLEIPYGAIQKYETFADLVLLEANQMLDRNEFSLAFRNLLYVYDHGGKSNPNVVETLRSCLFLDAREKIGSGEFEIALSIFEDLYEDKPDLRVPGIDKSLIDLIMTCYEGILSEKLDAGQFEAIRLALENIESRYGSAANDLSLTWRNRFNEKSDQLLDEAQKLARVGKGREAHLKTKQADRISPGRNETEVVQADLMAEFPLIVVGVSQGRGTMDPKSLDHWGARRVGRLTQRALVEVTGLADEGARYEFLNGTISRIDTVGLKYALDLDERPEKPVPPISAFQLASQLLNYANPRSSSYNLTWAKILATVEVQSESRVVVTLQRPFVRPEALMQIPYPSPTAPTSEEAVNPMNLQNGLFKLISSDEKFSFFGTNEAYANHESAQEQRHPVVIEQFFDADSDAVDALIKGEIDMVDRIPPSDYQKLKDIDNIQVRAFVIPTVHMLVPKIRGELKDSYRFRNALSTAIDRDGILNDVITNGQEIDGCVALTGPLPLGGDDNDQISYGYDLRIKPLSHNERLAMALTQLAISSDTESGKSAQKSSPKTNEDLEAVPDAEAKNDAEVETEAVNRPKLVLAHQDGSTVSNCAAAIARAWTAAGIPTTTRVLPPGETYPQDAQWDVLYTEVFIEEPVVDALRIIGPQGFAEEVSAPVEQSLRRVVSSQTWQEACLALRNIHRQIAVDLSVIPLYQIKEHCAYRDNVYDVGRDLVHLYQNVNRWKVETAAQAKRRKAELENQ